MLQKISPDGILRVACAAAGFVLAAFLVSGCASFGLVPAEELEAERQQRETLEARQQQLADELAGMTAARAELQTQLAAETQQRASLERDLQERESILERLQRLETKWEQQRREESEREAKAQEAVLASQAHLESQWAAWRDEGLKQQKEVQKALEYGDASLYLLLLEKDAQIARLGEQLESATQEVVRTKAKLRSLESKAEAASELAEAEIAIESLQTEGPDWERDPAVVKARELTQLSASEFDEENYGGSLYLTGRAKKMIRSAQVRSMSREISQMVEGEEAFALPLLLQIESDSDVMEGPGSYYNALFSLRQGTSVTGHSYKGQWVRVKTETGAGGWVFYKKLASSK